jgi:formylglycine-generating enzyme required for sulfatase activity/serine/threonine protein kinase
MQLQPGTLVLNGRYRIERLLGVGGSGEVYLASQTSWLAAPAALKILRRGELGVDTARIDDYRRRFELEGRLSVELGNHPAIVRVLEGGDYEGSPVVVMDYMSGGTLKAEIVAAAGKGLPWQRCADALREVATGLQVLHALGYVHRDVKPSNILLDAQHNAKIADLGVVQTELTRTRTDGLSFDHPCSPGYCSPEHAVGTAALSPAADVYALGVIGFEMLSGHLPQPSMLDQPIESIDGNAPDWFKALITRMLAYDYRERPKTGEAVALAIRDGIQNEREGAARRVARMAELGRKIEAVLAAQPRSGAELAEADRLLDELVRIAPNEPNTLDLSRRLVRALRDTPVAPPPPPPPEPIKPLTRQQRLRQVAELRLDLDPARRERRWDDVVRLAEALLDLAPDDRDAMSALNEAIFEQEKRKREIAGARETLSKRVADRAWDQIEAAAQALLALVPGDAEALKARADLAAELERQRVAAAQKKIEDLQAQAELKAEDERRRLAAEKKRAEDAARMELRGLITAQAWDRVERAAQNLLALAPQDADALKAFSDLQGVLDRRRVAVEKQQAEDAARSELRKVVGEQLWARVLDAAWALLALSPRDDEALKAEADARAHLDFRPGLRRVSADRMVLAVALGVEIEFVRVPAGPFLMGSNRPAMGAIQRIRRVIEGDAPGHPEDAVANVNELPQHWLDLPDYWIGKGPVTVAQFAQFVRSSKRVTQAEIDRKSRTWSGNGWQEVAGADWAHPRGPASNVADKQNHPASHLCWDDCIRFCEWASSLKSGEIALPSEAEWEKAARGSDGRIYPWGNEPPDPARVNYLRIGPRHGSLAEMSNVMSRAYDTSTVGSFGPAASSPFGCDDMAGNVWEWTRSRLSDYPYVASDGREDPDARGRRVLRGGSFLPDFDDVQIRCARRLDRDHDFHDAGTGFRVVLRLPSR